MLPYLAALVVGAALAVAGAALQSSLRNPLAEPFLLGTVGGAGLFASLAMHFSLTSFGEWVMPFAAFLGSCFSLALVCIVSALSSRRNGRIFSFEGENVVLAGFVTGSVTGSLQMAVSACSDAENFAAVSRWLFGDLSSVRTVPLLIASLATAFSLVVLMACSRRLDVFSLGGGLARSLGINVRTTALITLGAASLATASSVAIAGAIGFVGLVVPHSVRRFTGSRHAVFLPACAIAGGAFLAMAHFLASLLPGGIPGGCVCAIIGAPVFFTILIRRRPC